MRRIFQAVKLLVPSWPWLIAYWLATSTILSLVVVGLKTTSETTATLWGMRLNNFGLTSSEIEFSAFLEMSQHTWVLLGLPFLCFIGLHPLLLTFDRNFQEFLRFSRSRCLFMEGARTAALVLLVLAICGPFLIGSTFACYWLDLSFQQSLDSFVSCASPTLFVAVVTHFIVSCGVPRELGICLGFAAPFFLEAFSTFSERSEWGGAYQWLPPGMPHGIDSFREKAVAMSLIIAVTVIGLRMAHAWLADRTQDQVSML